MNQRVRQAPRESGDYRGGLIAVGTRHGKQMQFALAFAAILDARPITPRDLNPARRVACNSRRRRVRGQNVVTGRTWLAMSTSA